MGVACELEMAMMRQWIHKHTVLSTLFLLLLLYWLGTMWFAGRFAFTQEQELAAIERRLPHLRGRRHSGQFSFMNWIPFQSWEPDKGLVPLVVRNRLAVTPMLRENGGRDALFLLEHVVKTKEALLALRDMRRERPGAGIDLTFFVGMPLLAIQEDFGATEQPTRGSYEGERKTVFSARTDRWIETNAENIVTTDYGTGLRLPNGFTHPLGSYGVFIRYDKPEGRYDAERHVYISSQSMDDTFLTSYSFPGKVYYAYTDTTLGTVTDLESIKWQQRQDREGGRRSSVKTAPDFAANEFSRLLAERLEKDPDFLPFYPVMARKFGFTDLLGYKDSEHRPHGRWREYDQNHSVIRERWFAHGVETTQERYVMEHGNDLPEHFPATPEETACMLRERNPVRVTPDGKVETDARLSNKYPSFIDYSVSEKNPASGKRRDIR